MQNAQKELFCRVTGWIASKLQFVKLAVIGSTQNLDYFSVINDRIKSHLPSDSAWDKIKSNATHPELENGASHTCVTPERNRKAQNQPLQLLVTIERNMQFWVVVKTAAGRLGILLCVIVDGTKHRLRISTLHIWMGHQCTRGKILVRLYPLHQIAHIALTTAALTVAMGTLWVVRLWWGVVGESTTRRVWLNRRQLEDNEKNKLQFCSFRMCRNRFCNFVLAVKRH